MLLAVLDHVHSPPFLHLLSDKEHLSGSRSINLQPPVKQHGQQPGHALRAATQTRRAAATERPLDGLLDLPRHEATSGAAWSMRGAAGHGWGSSRQVHADGNDVLSPKQKWVISSSLRMRVDLVSQGRNRFSNFFFVIIKSLPQKIICLCGGLFNAMETRCSLRLGLPWGDHFHNRKLY